MRHMKSRPVSFETKLEAVRDGGLSFDQFVVQTRTDWSRLARYVLSRWSVPSAVEEQDIAQEMLLAAWRAVSAWDCNRGVTLKGYVLWMSITGAKKWIHSQRNALRRDDHNPSRHEISFSTLSDNTGDRSPVGEYQSVPVQPMQETLSVNVEICCKAFRCDSSELSGIIEELVREPSAVKRRGVIRSAMQAIAE